MHSRELHVMLGLPPDYLQHFLKAWKGKHEGFELSWRELEICRMAMSPISKSELRDKLMKKYRVFDEMTQSTFYRIVQDLVGGSKSEEDEISPTGYLIEREEGRSKIVQISPLGLEELGKVSRYILEMQIEGIKEELWIDLVEDSMSFVNCLLDENKTVLAIGPEYKAVRSVVRQSKICKLHEYHVEDTEDLLDRIIFLNYGADMTGKAENSRTIDVKLDDWPFKDNYADVIIEFTGLSSFKKDGLGVSLLQEAIRVTKPEGKIILFELTKETSRIARVLVQEVTQFLRSATPEDINWTLPDELLERTEIEDILSNFKEDVEILKLIPDIIITKVILKKK